MTVQVIIVIGFILGLIGIFFFYTKDEPNVEEEEDYNNRVIKTSRGEIKITRKHHLDLFLSDVYEFHLGDFLIDDVMVIGYIWISIMDEKYVNTEVVDLSNFSDSVFGITTEEVVEETEVEPQSVPQA